MKEDKTLIIVGWGNQAQSWACNLRDSHYPCKIYLRAGSHKANFPVQQGLSTVKASQLAQYQNFALLIPDQNHLEFLNKHQDHLPKAAKIIYAHGHSVHTLKLDQKFNQFEHLLLAPKSIASAMRKDYLNQQNIQAVFSTEHSQNPKQSESFLKELAAAIGIQNPYPVSFEEETCCDLFSEQSLLCGALPTLIEQNYNFLIQKGIPNHLAYLETWHEFFLIADVLKAKGPKEFFKMISPNALMGSQQYNQKYNKQETEKLMEELHREIKDGSFDQKIQKMSFKEIQNQVEEYWQQSPLQKMYQQMNESQS